MGRFRLKKNLHVGITSSGGDFVASQILSLNNSRENNFKIFSFNENMNNFVKHISTVFEIIPSGSDPNYVSKIKELINKYELDILLPWSDEEALTLSFNKERLESEGCKILVSSKDVMKTITNKYETYKKLKNAGLKTPEYTKASGITDIKKCINDYGFPKKTVIVKPASGRGGRGVHVFIGEDNPPDWLGLGRREVRLNYFDQESHNFDDYEDWLIMPCLKAPVYDVDVYCSKGNLINCFIRKRINPTGIPFKGNILMIDKSTEDYAKNICSVLNLDSLHDLDMMTHPTLGPILIEVIPRPSGSLGALSLAGFNFLEKIILSKFNKNIDFNSLKLKKNIPIYTYLEGKAF